MITRLDHQRIRRQFERAASTYEQAAFVQREVENRLLERLDHIALEPKRILDLGAGPGTGTGKLQHRYLQAEMIALDLAFPMLQQTSHASGAQLVCADARRLPLTANTVDLVFSNLMLPWVEDPASLFDELRRVMRPDGFFLFSSFGPDTLVELKTSWAHADGAVHVHEFLDMHHVGDALVNAGFADPIMEMERLTVNYDEVRELMRDLKAGGARNASRERPRSLTGKARFQRVHQAYETYRTHGKLPATYEVVYGHALAPREGQPRRTAGGQEAAVSIESLRRTIKRK